jgi:peptidoglycan hydrolase CwlO-like protein
MANDRESRFSDLKARLDAIRQQRSRDEGALEQNRQRLKKEFGCNSLEDARKKHAVLKKQVETDQVKLDEELTTLEADVAAMEAAIHE